jgi:hypothetical protein
VEERHAAEALEVTQMVLQARPELLLETLRDAKMMAEALDGVWTHLDRIARNAAPRSGPEKGIEFQRTPARVSARRAREIISLPTAGAQFSRVS